MSNSQRFDEHIKEQFLDYAPPVPAGIWENIISEREKRKPVGFWFRFYNRKNIVLLAVLLTAAGTGAYIFTKQSTGTKVKDSNTSFTETNSTLPGAAASISTAESNNNTVVPAIDQGNSNIQPAGSTGNSNANDANGNSSNTNKLFVTAGTKIKIRSAAAQEDGVENIVAAKRKHNSSSANNDYDIADADIITSSGEAQENQLSKLYFTAEKIAAAKGKLSLQKNNVPAVFLPGCPAIEKDAAGNKSYVEMYAGPDIAFRSLSDTGNSTYLQKRKESTSFTSAYSAGLRYTRVFNNGMSLRTGVNYSQINEKFTYVQGNLVQVTYIIDANGDTTGSYITTGTRYKTTYNKFRTVDVPLVVGYELGNGKLHANINAGVIINIYSWQKGEVLDASLKPVGISTGKASSPYQFKTNIGMGFLAGISLYYKLNEKAHLLAEPYFRYNLSAMSKENLTFKQKYNTAGLRLGLRIDLQ